MNHIRLRDLAKELGISRQTLYNWIDLGLPVYYAGSIPFLDKSEVDSWIKSNNKNTVKTDSKGVGNA